jgi:hypothetical protein
LTTNPANLKDDYGHAVEVVQRELGIRIDAYAQDGLAEYATAHDLERFARFYLAHRHALNDVFMSSAVDAVLVAVLYHEDKPINPADLELVRQVIKAAAEEMWACSVLSHYLEPTSDWPHEVLIDRLIRECVSVEAIKRRVAQITEDAP